MPFQPLRTFIAFFFISLSLFGQSGNIPYSTDYYYLLERYEVKSGQLAIEYHVNVKPFERRRVASYLEAMETDSMGLSKVDSFNLRYLKQDSWEWLSDEPEQEKGLWNLFFQQRSDFYHFKNDEFDIHVNPVFHFGGGSSSLEGEKQNTFINTRGIRIRGSVNNKLGFYTYFSENQAGTPFYVRDFVLNTDGYPYNGYTKVVNGDSLNMVRDYFQAEGYLMFYPSKNIMLRLGHSKNFIGSGIRSMILSDFSSPYFNFAANVKLGRLEYQNLLAKMNNVQEDFDVADLEVIPPKFMVFHHLNLNVTKNFNLGLFEMVMFGDRKFDMNYLNPVIFYRFVEGLIGSSDNALVGADFKLNLAKRVSLYGQLVLDEFNRSQNDEDGWYGQKNAGQLGMKYFDFLGARNLDFQFEYNYARPYTFSHFTTYSNLLNYNLPMAHPLGANFKETILRSRYQPVDRLNMTLTYLWNQKGYDSDTLNWGGDLSKNYRVNRPLEFGNSIGQGAKGTIRLLRLSSSYMLYHNLWIDVSYQKRRFFGISGDQNENLFKFGIRYNAWKEDYLF
ncbi:capsule assembly Wzi family protein [Jiulongibacter sediminis]|uniref:capsule assembly Wzi family protein n=1 Tax=Jiulongibacter sediminis TaxID=1605367 RepID=UPI0006DC59E4|nr:hypothetical protein [Jiulongibacter sediminis]